MAFGVLADLKIFLGIPSADTSEDVYLTNLLSYNSTWFETYCQRSFSGGQVQYTELYSGNGSVELVLNQRPVVPPGGLITMVVYMDDNAFFGSASGAWGSDTLLTYGVDYCLEIDNSDGNSYCGKLQNISGVWDAPYGQLGYNITPLFNAAPWGNIQVTYTAGYSNTPLDVIQALYFQVASARNSKNYGQFLSSESFGDGAGSASYSTKSQPKVGFLVPEVSSVLAKYKNISVA